jgi:sulfur-carrier protein
VTSAQPALLHLQRAIASKANYTRPMATVVLTSHLHAFFPQLAGRELGVSANTVAEVIAAMEQLAPGFAFYICDEAGRMRTHVNLFVDGQRVADRTRLSDPVGPDSEVFILQALSGG